MRAYEEIYRYPGPVGTALIKAETVDRDVDGVFIEYQVSMGMPIEGIDRQSTADAFSRHDLK